MDADAFLQTEGLTKVYASGPARVVALHDVTLSIGRGRFVGVTGASGSGKSTLMNLLGGLDTPSSGRLSVGGRCVSEMGQGELALFRRSTVGMIFQSFNLISSHTALDNVALPLIFAGLAKKERLRRAAELLSTVGLQDRAGHRPGELSGGEQQRVAIARALANRPQILLADEPTGNLDSSTSRLIVESLMGLREAQSLTVVMISHEHELLREAADEVIFLQDGAVTEREKLR